jgi:hypothetical protein
MAQSPLDNFEPFAETRHMLGWLGSQPELTLREQVEAVLRTQVEGSTLSWIRVIGEPKYITAGKSDPEGGQMIAGAVAVAFAFSLMAEAPGQEPWDLHGVASMIGVGLDEEKGQQSYRFFFELDADLDEVSSPQVMGERLRTLAGE